MASMVMPPSSVMEKGSSKGASGSQTGRAIMPLPFQDEAQSFYSR